MTTDKIYSDLEAKLAQFYTLQKSVEPTKENISQYFTLYANLRYFVERSTGKFLYEYDDKTKQFKGLNYAAISQNSEMIKKDAQGNVDQAATKDYIDEVFAKTNENFQKLHLIQEFGNYSRFHNKFGSRTGHATSYLPNINFDLRSYKDVSVLTLLNEKYFTNALTLLEKVAPKTCTALENKIKMNRKSKKPDEALWINDFLTEAEILTKPLKSKFSMNDYLDKKIMTLASALDDIDKDECSQPLMFNRSTEQLVMHFFNNQVSEKALNEYSTKDMKKSIKKLSKKKDDEE